MRCGTVPIRGAENGLNLNIKVCIVLGLSPDRHDQMMGIVWGNSKGSILDNGSLFIDQW